MDPNWSRELSRDELKPGLCFHYSVSPSLKSIKGEGKSKVFSPLVPVAIAPQLSQLSVYATL